MKYYLVNFTFIGEAIGTSELIDVDMPDDFFDFVRLKEILEKKFALFWFKEISQKEAESWHKFVRLRSNDRIK